MILLHILVLVLTGLAVLYADEQGFMWILGKRTTLDTHRVEILHVIVSVGIALVILTGGLLALRGLEYYLASSVFMVKMFFVAVLVVNGFFIGSISQVATKRSFASLSAKERLPLMFSGSASVLGWLGALVCGLLLGG